MRNENSPAAVLPTAARAERFINSSARRTSRRRGRQQAHRVDFVRINCAALARLPELLARWLPRGRIEGANMSR
jgi:hypothetical protein